MALNQSTVTLNVREGVTKAPLYPRQAVLFSAGPFI
jgi:hypothetical protein